MIPGRTPGPARSNRHISNDLYPETCSPRCTPSADILCLLRAHGTIQKSNNFGRLDPLRQGRPGSLGAAAVVPLFLCTQSQPWETKWRCQGCPGRHRAPLFSWRRRQRTTGSKRPRNSLSLSRPPFRRCSSRDACNLCALRLQNFSRTVMPLAQLGRKLRLWSRLDSR